MSYAVCLLPDNEAKARGMLRVVYESGEDYLYPTNMFAPVELPENLEAALKAA